MSATLAIWGTGALALAWLSRHALVNPRCHGFYRFFAFACSLGAVLPNLPHWHRNLFAPHQLLSWLLLFSALLFLGNALYLLHTAGGRRHGPRENFAFENTEHLIETGIFAYLRHPMYSALLLFTWGVWLKGPAPLGLVLCVGTSVFLWITTKIEERENFEHFGASYTAYQQRTRNFIPFVL